MKSNLILMFFEGTDSISVPLCDKLSIQAQNLHFSDFKKKFQCANPI